MKKWLKYIIISVSLFLIWAVIFISTMPLQFVLDKVQKQLPQQLNVNSVSGTIWSGSAQIIWLQHLSDKSKLDDGYDITLLWQWCPRFDIIGMCIWIQNSDLDGNAYVKYLPIDKHIHINNTTVNVKINQYQFSYQGFPVSLSGNGLLNIHDLTFSPSTFQADMLTADGEFTNVTSNGIQLGNYTWKSDYKKDKLSVPFKGRGENFVVEGRLDINIKAKHYLYYANLKTENKTLIEYLKNYSKVKGNTLLFSGSGVLPR